jgi:hypothetical protein
MMQKKKRVWVVSSNKFDDVNPEMCGYIYMDLLRKLTLINHREYWEEKSLKEYPSNDSDDNDDEKLLEEFRKEYIRLRDKGNNRRFVKTKQYPITEYRQHLC